MDIINILPDSVANQIAAGEVVDRPAGAVKELLENAMDAGAKQIDLVVKDAGRTLLQVTDNGCGMSESDARLCFERHATSKIHRADDLFAIHTMGFRGEALASIAAIAQVELRTRLTGSDLGTQVCIEGSHIVSQQPVACPEGTTMAVKNLFYNVPARRNFLKRDSVELGHIEEVFRRITLIHYDIGFSFVSNGRTLYDLRPGSMLGRIAGLFGAAYKERMYAVDEDTDLVRIHGFVSRPEFGRKTRGEQYIFVNGRFIKHPSLSAAVERAYGDLLPDLAKFIDSDGGKKSSTFKYLRVLDEYERRYFSDLLRRNGGTPRFQVRRMVGEDCLLTGSVLLCLIGYPSGFPKI